MIPDKYVRLMNAEIDGLNGEEESAALRRFLESSEEGRAYYESLRGVGETLREAGSAEPPPGLRGRILASVGAGCGCVREPSGRPSRAARLLGRIRGRPALTFAWGAVAGILLFSLVRILTDYSGRGSEEFLRGTAGIAACDCGRAPTCFEAGPVSCEARVSVAETRILVVLDIRAGESFAAELEAGGTARFIEARAPEGRAGRMEIDGARAACRAEAGSYRWSFTLDDPELARPPILVRILGAGDAVLWEEAIRTDG